jgi:hypothetical protein
VVRGVIAVCGTAHSGRLRLNHFEDEPSGVVRGTGGVRKVRWRSGGKGKSGGVRVIYYWATVDDQIFLLTLYGKAEKQDLSATDLRRVVKLLAEISDA